MAAEIEKSGGRDSGEDNKNTLWIQQVAFEVEGNWDVKSSAERESAVEHLSAILPSNEISQPMPLQQETARAVIDREPRIHHC